eukprot:Gb_40671 [translate_table: standard]
MAMDCRCSNEIKVSATNCNCKSGTEANSSWQRSVKRKFEGLNLECSHSSNKNLVSAEEKTGFGAEDIISEDIQCRQFYQQSNDRLVKECLAQPIKDLRNSIDTEDSGRCFISETSKQQAYSRTHLRLPEEKDRFNFLCNDALYSGFTSAVESTSPNKMFTEKRGAFRDTADREAESSFRLVEVENEVHTLREALRSQHQALQNLYAELEEERNASSSAANEALSMILRLQEEKAAVHMEARQFKRLAEEKLAHYQESLTFFEDLMYRKDKEIASLECEVQAYRHRLLSIGFDDLEIGKIRWPGRSYSNDREDHLALSGDCGSWTSSCAEKLEEYDGYDSVSWKIPNTAEYAQARDSLQRQDRKGKRHITKHDNICLDTERSEGTDAVDSCQLRVHWEDACSPRVLHGQDRTSGSSHRIQSDDYATPSKLNQETSRGYSNDGNTSYVSQGMDFDCKVRDCCDDSEIDVEPGISTSHLKVQSSAQEMAINTPELSPTGDKLTLWDRIERLEDRLRQLSKRRKHNSHLDDEWIATNKELQRTVAAYTSSLREGSKSHWRLSSDNTGICDGLMGEAEVESPEENRGLPSACVKSKLRSEISDTDPEVSCSEKNATDPKAADNESDMNFSVHDVYVVQHDSERTRRFKSHKGTALNFDPEDGDRLGKPDPLPQGHHEDGSCQGSDLTERKVMQSPSRDVQVSKAVDGVCSSASGIPVKLVLDNDPVQGEVKQLSMRLQVLEGDREFMKQAIDSLKREKEELTLLKEIAQQLRELKAPAKSLKVIKSPPPQEDASIVSFMKGILSFNVLRSNTQKNMDVGSCNNVGLSYLLEKAPARRLSACITRVVKVNTITGARIGHLGQATEAVVVTKQSVH